MNTKDKIASFSVVLTSLPKLWRVWLEAEKCGDDFSSHVEGSRSRPSAYAADKVGV